MGALDILFIIIIIIIILVFVGDYQNFEINSTTGWITVKAALDRDSASMASNGGVYAMFVQVSRSHLTAYKQRRPTQQALEE